MRKLSYIIKVFFIKLDPTSTYKKGYNIFSDYSQKELSRGYYIRNSDMVNIYSKDVIPSLSVSELPSVLPKSEESFDWRDKGVISSIKDQGKNYSSWAFSAAGAIEAAYNIKHRGEHIRTSVKQLLDCSSDKLLRSGGGNIINAFKFAKEKGVCFEYDKPYEEVINGCDANKCSKNIKLTDFIKVPSDKVQETLREKGPLSVNLTLCKDLLQYESGIFNDRCLHIIRHMAVLVGYGYDKASNQRYWIVKNSWGTDWGEKGYAYISRDTIQGDNICNIGYEAILPIIE